MQPQVEYASTIWSLYTKQNTQKIKMIQRRAARWVKNNYSTYNSVSTMPDNLGWRTLFMFHIIIYGFVAIQIQTYFEKPQQYTHPIHTHVIYYQQSFYPATIVLWNKLLLKIVLMDDLNSFKERVNKINNQSS